MTQKPNIGNKIKLLDQSPKTLSQFARAFYVCVGIANRYGIVCAYIFVYRILLSNHIHVIFLSQTFYFLVYRQLELNTQQSAFAFSTFALKKSEKMVSKVSIQKSFQLPVTCIEIYCIVGIYDVIFVPFCNMIYINFNSVIINIL